MGAIRYFLFLTILMVTSNAYAQEFSFDGASKSNIQVGLYYSLDTNLSSDNIEFDQYSGYKTNYNQNNFTAGLNLQYFMLRNFALYSGVSYSKRQFNGTFYCYTCDIVGTIQPQKFSLQFIQIPITVRYHPYKNKIGVFGELGLQNQLMLRKSNTNALEGNTYSVSAILGAGVEYSFGHGLTAQLSAKYTDSLSEIFKKADYSYKILGIQLSFLKEL